jgi:raw score 1.74
MDFIKKNLIKINRTLMFLDIHQKVRLFLQLF